MMRMRCALAALWAACLATGGCGGTPHESYESYEDRQAHCIAAAAAMEAAGGQVKSNFGIMRSQLVQVTLGDDALAHLKDLGKLTLLNLSRTKVQGRGLVHLRGHQRLDQLILDRTLVTDDELRHLAGLDRLKSLSLKETAITDDAGIVLAQMKGLVYLCVDSTRATEGLVAELRELPRLKTVVVAGKTISLTRPGADRPK